MKENQDIETVIKRATKVPEKSNDIFIGSLVFIDDSESTEKLFFQTNNSELIPMRFVWFKSNENNYENNNKNIPKPHLIRKDKIVEYGDKVLYTWINSKNILVDSSIYNLNLNKFDKLTRFNLTDYEDLRKKYFSRTNKKRHFSVLEDGKGNITILLEGKEAESEEDESGTGNIGIKVVGTEENGEINIELNGKFAITQVQGTGEEAEKIAQILMDNTADAEKIKIIDKYKNHILKDKNGIIIQDKTQNKIEMKDSGIDLTIKGICNINADEECTVNAPKVNITGGELNTTGSVTPTGQGPYCGIPSCIFSGAPHTGTKVSET